MKKIYLFCIVIFSVACNSSKPEKDCSSLDELIKSSIHAINSKDTIVFEKLIKVDTLLAFMNDVSQDTIENDFIDKEDYEESKKDPTIIFDFFKTDFKDLIEEMGETYGPNYNVKFIGYNIDESKTILDTEETFDITLNVSINDSVAEMEFSVLRYHGCYYLFEAMSLASEDVSEGPSEKTNTTSTTEMMVSIKMTIDSGKIDDSQILIQRNGIEWKKFNSSPSLEVMLEYQKEYLFIFSKNEYITKKVAFSTIVPKELIDEGFDAYRFEVTLFGKKPGVNFSYNKPIAKIFYRQDIDAFDYITDYEKNP